MKSGGVITECNEYYGLEIVIILLKMIKMIMNYPFHFDSLFVTNSGLLIFRFCGMLSTLF